MYLLPTGHVGYDITYLVSRVEGFPLFSVSLKVKRENLVKETLLINGTFIRGHRDHTP